jgi:hypothetical protein
MKQAEALKLGIGDCIHWWLKPGTYQNATQTIRNHLAGNLVTISSVGRPVV